MMFQRLIAAATVLALSAPAFAVTPQFWRTRTADEFLTGEVDGFAITSRGELRPAPAMTKVATFSDPFVLSQSEGAGSDRYFGTGNDGKVYRLRGSDLKVIFTASEPEIYALAFRDGALYVASSPNGKIYRVDPDNGKSTVFFDPKQAYIWSMAFSGSDLLAATGVDGKLFRIPESGQGTVLFDSTETHVRSLAVRSDRTILAGTSAKGRIYEINTQGQARALFDSSLNEISAIYIDSDGTGWASGVSNVLPAAPPAKPAAQQGQAAASADSKGGAASSSSSSSAGTVDVSFSFDDGGAASAQTGSAELYRISRDGYVETARKFEREMIYSIGGAPDGGVLLSSGPQGRLYHLKGDDLALLGAVPEKQIVSISRTGDSTLITTTNSGAVYRMTDSLSKTGEFRSSARDFERFSRFGSYRIEGQGIGSGAVAIAFRSGNTRTPDSTWSAWTLPRTTQEGAVDAPSARYLQWKVTVPKPSKDIAIDSVAVAFVNRNVAPTIEFVTVQEPAVVFISSAYPASPQLVEATNPDENGIFNSLDTPKDRSNDPGKRAFRKGYRTITWRARDENNDSLRYDLAFRARGTSNWLRLRDDIDDMQYNFDTSQLADGVYEVKLTASDVEDNPDAPLTTSREGVEFVVDNTPPRVDVKRDGANFRIVASDALSPIGRLEYAIDAEKWTRLAPVDGIADSTSETFQLDAKDLANHFVIVRAIDGFFNVATATVR
jgi:outer membrane protein assembly factor BamB